MDTPRHCLAQRGGSSRAPHTGGWPPPWPRLPTVSDGHGIFFFKCRLTILGSLTTA